MGASMGKLFFVLTVVASLLATTNRSNAQAIEVAIASEFVGRKIQDIIEKFKQTGSQLLDQANASGNALLSRAANESNVLGQNLSFQLRDRIDQTFDAVDEQQKQFIIEAEKIRRTLSALPSQAYEIKDTFVLDLNYLAAKFPFVSNDFFVQSIRGLAFLPSGGDFQMRLAASTLGIQENIETTIKMQIDGKEVALTKVDQSTQRGLATISIPNAALVSHFKPRDLVTVKANLQFLVNKPSGWWIFRSNKTATYDVPVYIALYPPRAADVVIEIKQPIYGWSQAGQISQPINTPNRHCEKKCKGDPTRGPNHIEFAVAGGPEPYKDGYQRLVSPTLQCLSGGICAYSAIKTVALSSFDTRAYADFDTWSRPTTWILSASVETWGVKAVVDAKSQPTDVTYSSLFQVDVPANYSFAKLLVTTFTGKKYELEVGKPDPTGLLEYQSKNLLGNGRALIVYKALEPI